MNFFRLSRPLHEIGPRLVRLWYSPAVGDVRYVASYVSSCSSQGDGQVVARVYLIYLIIKSQLHISRLNAVNHRQMRPNDLYARPVLIDKPVVINRRLCFVALIAF